MSLFLLKWMDCLHGDLYHTFTIIQVIYIHHYCSHSRPEPANMPVTQSIEREASGSKSQFAPGEEVFFCQVLVFDMIQATKFLFNT